jgi:hypothetical protein
MVKLPRAAAPATHEEVIAMKDAPRSIRFATLAAAATLCTLIAAAQKPELAAGRDAWRAAKLASYEYGYRKFCECHPDTPPETVVTVREGKVVGVRHRPVGLEMEVQAEARNLEFYWTMDGLFDLVDSALGRGATVRASYDSALGFPTEVYIDYDANFIGDELDVRLTAVTPLAP